MRATLPPQRQQRPGNGPGDSAGRPGGLAERVFRARESGIVVVLAVFVAVTALVQHRFLNVANI